MSLVILFPLAFYFFGAAFFAVVTAWLCYAIVKTWVAASAPVVALPIPPPRKNDDVGNTSLVLLYLAVLGIVYMVRTFFLTPESD